MRIAGIVVTLFLLAAGAGRVFAGIAPCLPGETCAYLPIAQGGGSIPPTPTTAPTATIAPTATPTLPPPSYTSCAAQPDILSAPEWPVWILDIDKFAETVTLENLSDVSVSMDGWIMCSLTGGQQHTGISGTLAPGEVRTYPYTGSGNIWNNSEQDDGALYTPDGRLASYYEDF